MSYDAFDHLARRCPMLGGEVDFGYCRTLSGGLPCRRALECWEAAFPAERYFRLVLEEETFRSRFVEPAPCPTDRLWLAVDRARKRSGG